MNESFPCAATPCKSCRFVCLQFAVTILFVVEGILGLPLQMGVFLNGGIMEVIVGGH